jgi:hypothetical protein
MDKEIIAIKEAVIELIVNIDKRIDDIVSSYEIKGSLDQERLRNVLEDMQALAEGIDAIGDYFTGVDLLEYKEKLEMLMKALESSDTALLTDIMQFEMKDLLGYWKDCLTK